MTNWNTDHERYANCVKTWINNNGEQLIVQDLREVLDASLLPAEKRFQVIFKESSSAPLAAIAYRETEDMAVAVVEGLLAEYEEVGCSGQAVSQPVEIVR